MTPQTAAATNLEITEIDSFYGELQVLRQASLHIDVSEVVALFGPNGH